MKGRSASGPRLARAVLVALAALALTACATGGGSSPPPVDVPEPGARGNVTHQTARPAQHTTVPRPSGTVARTLPPGSLPLPAPGVPQGGATASGTRSYPGATTQSTPPPTPEAPLAIEMERAPASAAPALAPTAVDSSLVSPEHVPARSQNNAVNALLAQADSARRSGQLDAAVAAAERALRIAPADPAVYYELAVLRLRQGDRARAEQLARKGLSNQPDMELRQRLEDLLAGLRSG